MHAYLLKRSVANAYSTTGSQLRSTIKRLPSEHQIELSESQKNQIPYFLNVQIYPPAVNAVSCNVHVLPQSNRRGSPLGCSCFLEGAGVAGSRASQNFSATTSHSS